MAPIQVHGHCSRLAGRTKALSPFPVGWSRMRAGPDVAQGTLPNVEGTPFLRSTVGPTRTKHMYTSQK